MKKKSTPFNLTDFVEVAPNVYQKRTTQLQPRDREKLLSSVQPVISKSAEKPLKESLKNSKSGPLKTITQSSKPIIQSKKRKETKIFRRTEQVIGTQTLVYDEHNNWYYRKTTPDLIFEWSGEHISLNKWYESKHWQHRNKAANYWHHFFKKMLPKHQNSFVRYTMTLEYNSGLDVSNTITMIKLCEDLLQTEKIIKNDTKDYCKGIHLIPVDEMPKFTYKLTVKEI